MSVNSIEFKEVRQFFTSAFVKTVKVTEVRGGSKDFFALVYRCRLNVDWDGSPFAYGFDNGRDTKPAGLKWSSKDQKFVREREDHFQRNLMPLESGELMGGLRDATSPIKDKDGNPIGLFVDNLHQWHWVGVASATKGEARANNLWIDDRDVLRDVNQRFPVIQKDGPAKGYYVSQSGSPAISKEKQAATPGWQFQQSSFWDASTIPYCVYPSMLPGAFKGDFGLAIAEGTGRSCGFFFADTGSTIKLGECSGFLVKELSGLELKRKEWAHASDVWTSFIVFPGSGGGDVQEDQKKKVRAEVIGQIAKLSGAGNAEELCTFLALGGDAASFNRGYDVKDKSKGKSPLPPPGSVSSKYDNLLHALKKWGFHTSRQPVRV